MIKHPTYFRLTYVVIILALMFGVYATSKPPAVIAQPSTQQKPVIDKTLSATLSDWSKQQSASYSVAVQELNGQQRVARVNAQAPMATASTYKLYVAYGILHKVEQGKLTLQTRLKTGQTVNDCMKTMILISDNTCGRTLGFLAGWRQTEQLLTSRGIPTPYLNNYDANDLLLSKDKTSTAQAHLSFLRQLQRGELMNTSHTDLLLSLMKKQQWRERIPAGVPDGIAVADKPGWLPGVQNDAAIVYGPKSTYVIVILSDGNSPTQLSELSEVVYNYLQK